MISIVEKIFNEKNYSFEKMDNENNCFFSYCKSDSKTDYYYIVNLEVTPNNITSIHEIIEDVYSDNIENIKKKLKDIDTIGSLEKNISCLILLKSEMEERDLENHIYDIEESKF